MVMLSFDSMDLSKIGLEAFDAADLYCINNSPLQNQTLLSRLLWDLRCKSTLSQSRNATTKPLLPKFRVNFVSDPRPQNPDISGIGNRLSL
jgi:hypothetical protein